MNEFIEKNRGLLGFYCIAVRIIGWVLLVVPGVVVIVDVLSGDLMDKVHSSYILYLLIQQIINFMLLGLVLLGVALFIGYLYDKGYPPGWILRHGNKILYLYATTLVVEAIVRFCFLIVIRNASDLPINFYFLHWLPDISKGLILVGLGQVLKRIMPVIEESKTLV